MNSFVTKDLETTKKLLSKEETEYSYLVNSEENLLENLRHIEDKSRGKQ